MQTPDRLAIDVNAAKRRLFQMGRERGYITEAEILGVLGREHTSTQEMEMLLFTFEMMEVEVRNAEGAPVTGAATVRLAAGN